jgi:hypothetical protein
VPIRSHIYLHTNGQPTCQICHEPINLRTAKSDGDGKAVHEECYVQKVLSEKPAISDNADLDRHQRTTTPEERREMAELCNRVAEAKNDSEHARLTRQLDELLERIHPTEAR